MRLCAIQCFVAKDLFGGYAAFVVPDNPQRPYDPLRLAHSSGEHVSGVTKGTYIRESTREKVEAKLVSLEIAPLSRSEVKEIMARMWSRMAHGVVGNKR